MPFLGKTPAQIVDPEVDIDGGSIDGATIGATSASAATVTTFTSTGIDDNAASNAMTINSSNDFTFGGNITTTLMHTQTWQTGSTTLTLTPTAGATDSFVFDTSQNSIYSFSMAGTQKLSVDSDGLKFNSDTAAANALDDYEEGTWTPVYKTSNGDHSVASYHAQVGTYTKIGNTVFVTCYLFINSLTSAGTGNPYIDGLPFPKTDGEMRFPLVNYNIAAHSSTYPFATGYANANQSAVLILMHRQQGVWSQATTSGNNQFLVQSGSLISFTGTYLTG